MDITGRIYPYSKLVSVRTSVKRVQFSFIYLARLLLLCTFLYTAYYTFHDFIFFYVSDRFLENTLHFYPLSLSTRSTLESNVFFHSITEKNLSSMFHAEVN